MTEKILTVLLIEDNEIDRMAIQRHVEKSALPYHLNCAMSKESAIQKLNDSVFDIVLMDYQLPDGTAFDILPHVMDLPTIFVTGSGSEQVAAEAMRKGAYDYLIKDPDGNYLTVLSSTITNALKRYTLEKEKDNLIRELRQALEDVKQLSGLLPICASCKKIRDDKGYWNQIESYLKKHTGADFSHSLCPECAKKLYPDLIIEE